jgi:hypothetical protein
MGSASILSIPAFLPGRTADRASSEVAPGSLGKEAGERPWAG